MRLKLPKSVLFLAAFFGVSKRKSHPVQEGEVAVQEALAGQLAQQPPEGQEGALSGLSELEARLE